MPDQQWIEAVGPIDGLETVAWDLHAPSDRADDIEVVIPPSLDKQVDLAHLRDLPSLRLVQMLTAGFEQVLPHLPDGVRLANAAGVHDASTAELTLALTLASLRGIPE